MPGSSPEDERKKRFRELYPDVSEPLHLVLAEELERRGSGVEVDGDGFITLGTGENRKSQIYMAALERLFMADLWECGVELGNLSTSSLQELVEYLVKALEEEWELAEISALFKTFKPTEHAQVYLDGADAQVRHQWESLLTFWRREAERDVRWGRDTIALLEAAHGRPELRQLYPYTSMNRVCFSRCTGYPFTFDCPFAFGRGDGLYEVQIYDRSRGGYGEILLGRTDLQGAIDLLAEHLPAGTGPAVQGTSDQLESD